MNFLFLDLSARKTGFAYGDAGKIPTSGSIVLHKQHGQDKALAIGVLARWIRDHVKMNGKPDLIGVEKWLPMAAAKDQESVEDALRLNGAVHAVAGVYAIPVVEPHVSTIRSQVCGRAHDKHGVGTKRMVLDTMAMRGYFLPSETDEDRADACAGFCWLEANFSRVPPANFSLTPKA